MQCFLYFLLAGLMDVTIGNPLEISGSPPSTVALTLMASVIVTLCFMALCVSCKKKSTSVSPEVKIDRNARKTSIGTFSVKSEDLTPVNTTHLNIDTKSKTITRKISNTERVRVKQPDTIFE